MKVYEDCEYARSRLNDTIVMHKRSPVRVVNVCHDMKAKVCSQLNIKAKPYFVGCEELNILNMSLGFLNERGVASFLARRTLRHDWRQGLRPNNVSSTNIGVSYKTISKALLHRYPTFDESLLSVVDKSTSCAWCEDFAIKSDMSIVWRYDVVGKFTDGYIKLNNKFVFLTNAIKESINGCYEVL